MSLADVARKDLTSVRRSRGLWVAVTLLAVGTALGTYGFEVYGYDSGAAVAQLFADLALAFGVLLPLVALVGSYLAIVGERRSGGIKFLLGFPNTRRDVYLGKLRSRLTLVGGIVCFAFLPAISVAVTKFGALPVVPVAGVLAVSLAYAAVFVAVAVALSAAFAARGRAVAAAVGSYLGLVVFFVVPGAGAGGLVRWLHVTMLEFDPNPYLYDAVNYASPYVAYRKATNLVLPPDQRSEIFRRSASVDGDLPAYLGDEASLVVFAAWFAVPAVVGYLQFARADLH